MWVWSIPVRVCRKELPLPYPSLGLVGLGLGCSSCHSGRGVSVAEEWRRSFSAYRGLAEVLSTFLGHVVGWRGFLAAGGQGLWLEMGVSAWRSLRHIGCLWSAFQAFSAPPLVHALINVGWWDVRSLSCGQISVLRQRPRKIRYYLKPFHRYNILCTLLCVERHCWHTV